MQIIDVLLLVVKGEGKKGLCGRTLLQKKVYFLSVLLNEPYGFTAHYYGPYSSYVAGNLESLVNCGFLDENTESFAAASGDRNLFGEIRRHTYTLTNDGNEVWSDIEKEPNFEKWKNALDMLNEQPISNDFNKLSIAAKVHYIIDWREKGTIGEVKQVAEEYGWNVKAEDIESVLSFLKGLGLVTTDESDDIPF